MVLKNRRVWGMAAEVVLLVCCFALVVYSSQMDRGSWQRKRAPRDGQKTPAPQTVVTNDIAR